MLLVNWLNGNGVSLNAAPAASTNTERRRSLHLQNIQEQVSSGQSDSENDGVQASAPIPSSSSSSNKKKAHSRRSSSPRLALEDSIDDECASVIIIGSKKKDHSPVDRRSGTFGTVDVNVHEDNSGKTTNAKVRRTSGTKAAAIARRSTDGSSAKNYTITKLGETESEKPVKPKKKRAQAVKPPKITRTVLKEMIRDGLITPKQPIPSECEEGVSLCETVKENVDTNPIFNLRKFRKSSDSKNTPLGSHNAKKQLRALRKRQHVDDDKDIIFVKMVNNSPPNQTSCKRAPVVQSDVNDDIDDNVITSPTQDIVESTEEKENMVEKVKAEKTGGSAIKKSARIRNMSSGTSTKQADLTAAATPDTAEIAEVAVEVNHVDSSSTAFEELSVRDAEEQSPEKEEDVPPSEHIEQIENSARALPVTVKEIAYKEDIGAVEYMEEEYTVDRVIQATKDKKGRTVFLVKWNGYNYTQCTIQTREDLDNSPEVYKQFIEKEKGLLAITKNLQDSNYVMYGKDVAKLFQRKKCPPSVGTRFSEHEYQKILSSGVIPKSHGYWRVKYLELEWLKVLQSSSASHAPLYLEGWHVSAITNLPKLNFVTESVWTKNAKELVKENAQKCQGGCCECSGLCDDCAYMPRSIRCTIEHGLLKMPDPLPFAGTSFYVFECTPRQCRCKKGCGNSIVEGGRKIPLVIFYEPRIKGWGVRAISTIPKGSFVSEYVGEIQTAREAADRDSSYQFEMEDTRVLSDAVHYGNESRFFSHSCAPNMISVKVMSEGKGRLYHKICLFATRDIVPGEELTFDYHPEGQRPHSGWSACRCGASNCRKWL